MKKQAILLLLVFITACVQTKPDPPVNWKGPNDRNDLVFLYKKVVSYEQKQEFEAAVLYKPYVPGHGRALRDGVADMSIGHVVAEYDGGLINFHQNSTPEQREELKRAIEESPLVYRIYENIVPSALTPEV